MRSPTFKRPLVCAGPPGNEALDLGVAVFASQHRADADEREPHVDAEILQIGRAQVFRVRIVGLGQRVEEQFDLLVGILLVDVAQHPVVAALDQFRSGLDRMIGQFFLEQFVLDPLAPEIVGLRFVLRPGRLLPAEEDGFVRLEIHRLLEQFLDFLHPVFHPFLENGENIVGRLEVAEQDIVVERGGVFGGESVDVLLGEKEMAEIEHLEVTGEQLARDLVVQRMMSVVAFLEQTPDGEADLLGIRLRADRLRSQRDDQQTRQQRKRTTKEIFHKIGQKSSQKSI